MAMTIQYNQICIRKLKHRDILNIYKYTYSRFLYVRLSYLGYFMWEHIRKKQLKNPTTPIRKLQCVRFY